MDIRVVYSSLVVLIYKESVSQTILEEMFLEMNQMCSKLPTY